VVLSAWDAALVDKPGLGKVVIGRGAVNQKGPEATFLAALHAIRGAGRKLPVNLVFVAEGEEEIGSPHFHQVVHRPDVLAAVKKCSGIFMPSSSQGLDGEVTVTLGAKGVVELELISSGEKWGAARVKTSTPATKRASTVPPGISSKLWPRWSRQMATIPPSKASPPRPAQFPRPKRK